MPTSSTVGRQMPTDSYYWSTCCGRVHKDQLVFFCQIIIAYIVIITSLANITFTEQNTCLWAKLASGTIGYLLPSQKIKHDQFSRNTADNSLDTYLNNTASRFTVKLLDRIELKGDYEVGLTLILSSISTILTDVFIS
jgi:hypothetical protein